MNEKKILNYFIFLLVLTLGLSFTYAVDDYFCKDTNLWKTTITNDCVEKAPTCKCDNNAVWVPDTNNCSYDVNTWVPETTVCPCGNGVTIYGVCTIECVEGEWVPDYCTEEICTTECWTEEICEPLGDPSFNDQVDYCEGLGENFADDDETNCYYDAGNGCLSAPFEFCENVCETVEYECGGEWNCTSWEGVCTPDIIIPDSMNCGCGNGYFNKQTYTGLCGNGYWYVQNGDYNCPCDCNNTIITTTEFVGTNHPNCLTECGSANKVYPFGSFGFGFDTFCNIGTPSPAIIGFPAPGNSVNWTCNGLDGGETGCFAGQGERLDGNGVCGSAAKTYLRNENSFGTDTFCAYGNPNSNLTDSNFPPIGGFTDWVCVGDSGKATPHCIAKKSDSFCGTAAGDYSANESFPRGDYCLYSRPLQTLPKNPIFGESSTWVCADENNDPVWCLATRGGTSIIGPGGGKNSILSCTGEAIDGNVFINARCSSNTSVDLNLVFANTLEPISISPSVIDCTTSGATTQINLDSSIEIEKTRVLLATCNVSNYLPNCVVCSRQTFLSFNKFAAKMNIPDSSPLMVIVLLITVLFILTQKQKK
ncbi:MAG: hypothetical protein WC821_01190 [archaeon]